MNLTYIWPKAKAHIDVFIKTYTIYTKQKDQVICHIDFPTREKSTTSKFNLLLRKLVSLLYKKYVVGLHNIH